MASFRRDLRRRCKRALGRATPATTPGVAQANNATFGAQAAYDELVPAFEALFAARGPRLDAVL